MSQTHQYCRAVLYCTPCMYINPCIEEMDKLVWVEFTGTWNVPLTACSAGSEEHKTSGANLIGKHIAWRTSKWDENSSNFETKLMKWAKCQCSKTKSEKPIKSIHSSVGNLNVGSEWSESLSVMELYSQNIENTEMSQWPSTLFFFYNFCMICLRLGLHWGCTWRVKSKMHLS